ncbi:MAG: cytochrome-c peroxidase, partial [Actinobacteria bacterium]|nr:cytochrome-c peroxidase [Actinomycetota bacterium]
MRSTKPRFVVLAALVVVFTAGVGCADEGSPDEAQMQSLGKSAFFDANLSINRNRSCSSCHAPSTGWVVPEDEVNAARAVYEGSVPDTFGDRKPMSAAYSTQAPIFHMAEPGVFVGGNFWDGRATGEHLDSPAADQAQGPLLNPVEQALPDPACVVLRVTTATYSSTTYSDVWGSPEITWPADA